FFFFQAEDGIRDFHVTRVQTCALPISNAKTVTFHEPVRQPFREIHLTGSACHAAPACHCHGPVLGDIEMPLVRTAIRRLLHLYRSEERRVGKECRAWWCPRE